MGTANWTNETMWTGDNLPIMRGMNSESVDLIYLDPPFNSKANYAAPIGSQAAGAEFKDTWTLSDINVAELDLIEVKHPRVRRVIDAAMTDSDKSYMIYMAARLLHMHRILKPAGSLYLHCNQFASHYLKLLMDAIFGRRNFRNEIVWQRVSNHNDTKSFGRVADLLLFYGSPINAEDARVPLKPSYVADFYRYTDDRGRYRVGDITAKGLSGGGYYYDYHGHHGPWRYPEDRLRQLESEDRIHFPKKRNGVPGLKRYLEENKGRVLNSIWTDIPNVQPQSKERTGYPTQKPLALLQRIIKASSNPGDMVLDPFCGCATACVAAHDPDPTQARKWTGIDVSSKAYDLVKQRIEDRGGLFYNLVNRTDVPQRTDLGPIPAYNAPTNKTKLYGEQGGYCAGCAVAGRKVHFEPRHLTIDHIIATSVGGTDHIGNLQLLCGNCNSIKGNRGMEYLVARLARG